MALKFWRLPPISKPCFFEASPTMRCRLTCFCGAQRARVTVRYPKRRGKPAYPLRRLCRAGAGYSAFTNSLSNPSSLRLIPTASPMACVMYTTGMVVFMLR